MTEKRDQKTEICKTLSLGCHIKVQHADQWHHFVEVQVAVRVSSVTRAQPWQARPTPMDSSRRMNTVEP